MGKSNLNGSSAKVYCGIRGNTYRTKVFLFNRKERKQGGLCGIDHKGRLVVIRQQGSKLVFNHKDIIGKVMSNGEIQLLDSPEVDIQGTRVLGLESSGLYTNLKNEL